MLFQQAMFGDGPLGREICGDEAGIRALPERGDPRLLARDVPPGEHRRRGGGRPRARRGGRAGRRRHSDRATARCPGSRPRRRCPPASASSPAAATRRRRSSASASRRSAATIPTRGPSRCSTRCSATGCRSRLFLAVREEKGLAYDVSSGIVDYADAGALEVSAGVDPGSLPAAIEAILRELARLARRAGPGRASSRRPRRTSPAASSCGWTRPATSPRGSAARRRSTTGCYTLDEALGAVEAVRPGGDPAPRRRAVPRRGAPAGGRRPGEAPARPRRPPPAVTLAR